MLTFLSFSLYTSPLLLNGLLWLVYSIKKRNSHYTQIAEGLGFLLWLLLIGLVLNTAVGVLEWHHGYRLPGAAHLALVTAVVAGYCWFGLK
jgi:hypothetical protein